MSAGQKCAQVVILEEKVCQVRTENLLIWGHCIAEGVPREVVATSGGMMRIIGRVEWNCISNMQNLYMSYGRCVSAGPESIGMAEEQINFGVLTPPFSGGKTRQGTRNGAGHSSRCDDYATDGNETVIQCEAILRPDQRGRNSRCAVTDVHGMLTPLDRPDDTKL